MVLLRVYLREFLFIIAFSVLHGLIFHWPEVWWLAFFSLVPFFFLLESLESRKEAFILGYVAGVLFAAVCFYWVIPVSVVGFLALAIYLGIYPALFAFLSFEAIRILGRTASAPPRFGWTRVFYVAAAWVLIEYLRSNVPILKFPWALLSYSQWKNVIFIQSADRIGPYGLSLLIVLVNLVIYAAAGVARRLFLRDLSLLSSFKEWAILGLIVTMILGPHLAYGHRALAAQTSEAQRGNAFRVAVVQGNVPQKQKFDARIRDVIFRKYEGLSRQTALEDPDLIIWPETAFPGYWEVEPEMVERLRKVIRDLKTRFLIGVPTLNFKEGSDVAQNMNTAVYLEPSGREIGRYNKLRLVPFGEYVPFFGFVRNFYDIGAYHPGESFVLMRFPETVIASTEGAKQSRREGFLFSTLICFEDIFPDMSRRLVREGTDVLINMTNDAWFENTTGPYQHAQASVLRAVENRVHVVRAANTGLSCLIDPTGTILKTVSERGKEIEVTGYLTGEIRVRRGGSFYTRWGDWIVWLCFFVVLIGVIRPLRR